MWKPRAEELTLGISEITGCKLCAGFYLLNNVLLVCKRGIDKIVDTRTQMHRISRKLLSYSNIPYRSAFSWSVYQIIASQNSNNVFEIEKFSEGIYLLPEN